MKRDGAHFGIECAAIPPALAKLWAWRTRTCGQGRRGLYAGPKDLGATSHPHEPRLREQPGPRDLRGLRDGRIAERPNRKRSRPVPARAIAMLAVVSHGKCLVERNAATGICEGCGPPRPEDALRGLVDDLGQADDASSARAFTHAFTPHPDVPSRL